MSLPAPIAAMLEPDFYPHRPPKVELVQTHISYVLLAGNEVYKVKKPVRFSFLDFSTLQRRRHFCHEEVRLNRRLARDTYIGVVAICETESGYQLGSDDAPNAVDYAVHMRRLPAHRMLDHLLEQHMVNLELVDRIAERLVTFHDDAAAGPYITANGEPAAIRQVIEDNYTGVEAFRDITIPAADDDAIQAFSRRFLERNETLLRTRQAEQRIRDCHGDLHSEHICCTEPLTIFDCIEFNEAFRYCDVASEIAFLAMDFDYHGQPELAAHLVARYAVRAADPDVHRLMPFYQCHRAYVRGKVDSLKSAEEEVAPAEREMARASAWRHFALAYRYTWRDHPIIVLIAGLSGTGKSAIAAALHARTGFAHISSDVVRKRLAGLLPTAQGTAAYESALYSPEHSARTYAAVLAEAAQQLAGNQGVILDATFQRRSDRDAARSLAREHHVPLLIVVCRCSDEEIRRRLGQRSAERANPSDADWDVYVEQRRRYEPFIDDESENLLVIDTTAPVADLTATIESELRRTNARWR